MLRGSVISDTSRRSKGRECSSNTFRIVVADRKKVDPSGKSIHQIITREGTSLTLLSGSGRIDLLRTGQPVGFPCARPAHDVNSIR